MGMRTRATVRHAPIADDPGASSHVETMQRQATPSNSGSRWHRWEPHIHAPGTVLNDQFEGTDSWEPYLEALERTAPPIRALGVTDYYNTETYERVIEAKRNGQLAACDLIFPNIEMRLGVGTVKGKWVNIHLLVSPDDPNHLAELKRFLARLTFKAHEDTYCCNKDDLIRLGQRFDPKLKDPAAALQCGSEGWRRRDASSGGGKIRSCHLREQCCAARLLARTAQPVGRRDTQAVWELETVHPRQRCA